MRIKGILFFTSPIGLGHASRDIAIASLLKESLTDEVEITFVTSDQASRHIIEHGFKALNVYRAKSIDADAKGYFRHRLRWLIDYMLYYKECKVKASKVIDEYKPRLIISDEDFASIAVAKGRGIKSVLVTDVFESRFLNGITSIIEVILNRTLKKIIHSADLVLVPMHGEDHGNVMYVGPIVREISKSREELREVFGFSNDEMVVTVSVGGTSSGKFLIDATLRAYSKVKDVYEGRSGKRLRLIIVSGPSLDYTLDPYLDDHIIKDIRLDRYINNMHELVYASDLLISLAGRSTIDEANAYHTPAIFIPIRNHFEQESNAREYGFSYSDINRLDDLMLKYLDASDNSLTSNNNGNIIKDDGKDKILRAVRTLMIR